MYLAFQVQIQIYCQMGTGTASARAAIDGVGIAVSNIISSLKCPLIVIAPPEQWKMLQAVLSVSHTAFIDG